MLSITPVSTIEGHLAQATAAVEDIPDRFADRYKLLEIASNSIRNAHTQLVALWGTQGGADMGLIQDYNDALDAVTAPIERAFEERNEAVADEGLPPEDPDLPPKVDPGTFGGLGAVSPSEVFAAMAQRKGFVPASQLRFLSRNGTIGTLADAARWDREARQREAALYEEIEGLGAIWIPLAVIAGLAFLVWQVAKTYRTKYVETRKIEVARSEAAIAASTAQVAEAITGTQRQVFAECAAKAKNAAEVQACADKASAAATAAGKAAAQAKPEPPKAPPPPAKGLGVFTWIGIVAVVGVASVGGYLLYRHRRERSALRITERAERAREIAPPAEVEAEEAELEFVTMPRAKARFRRSPGRRTGTRPSA